MKMKVSLEENFFVINYKNNLAYIYVNPPPYGYGDINANVSRALPAY